MNDHKNKVKITVENLFDDKKLELTVNRFSDLNDWTDVFKTILIHQTFAHDSVKELFEPEEIEPFCPNCIDTSGFVD
jgi:hypothetical protein